MNFIEEIAPLIQKHAPDYGIKICSPIIAQAILESARGTSELAKNAHNYFGLKYRADRCPTACGIYHKRGSEQNTDGSYMSSDMQWMKFPDMEQGVIGYFDFINIPNYTNLKGVTSPETYLKNIKKDGYATSLNYVDSLLNVIKEYTLTKYDDIFFINNGGHTMFKIAIDAGHGSNTAGKRTPDGYREHWINVRMAYYFDIALKRCAFQTLKVGWDDADATDDSDTPLTARQKQIKDAKCDASVSWHANAYGDGKSYHIAQGIETFIHSSSTKVNDSKALALKIQKHLLKGTPQKNRGVKTLNLSMCNCPAMGTKASVLIEAGFMTNEYEANLLKTDTFCLECAEEAAQGVCEYFDVPYVSESNILPATPSALKIEQSKKAIQIFLNTHYEDAIKAVIGGTLTVDGIIGRKSRKTIAAAFQTELNKLGAGLSVDGSIGPASENAFNHYVGTLKKGSKGIFVTLWQCVLVGNDQNPNGIDGKFGPGCAAATNRLFAKNGLREDASVSGADLNTVL